MSQLAFILKHITILYIKYLLALHKCLALLIFHTFMLLAARPGKMNPTRESETEPESFIRVWVRGYSGQVVIGSTRLTRLLFRVGYGSRVIGFGSGQVGCRIAK